MTCKNVSSVLIAVSNLLNGKLCCSVVKPYEPNALCIWKEDCKLRFFN